MDFTKFDCFTEDMAHGVHDLSSDTLVMALTNVAPVVATDHQLSDITQISYTNLSSRTITLSSSAQTSGVYKIKLVDLVLTASGTVPEFRYFVIYNEDAANDELLGYGDYAAAINLTTGAELTVDFDATNGVFTVG